MTKIRRTLNYQKTVMYNYACFDVLVYSAAVRFFCEIYFFLTRIDIISKILIQYPYHLHQLHNRFDYLVKLKKSPVMSSSDTRVIFTISIRLMSWLNKRQF